MILSRVAVGDGGIALAPVLALADAKKHLDVYHDDDDDMIEALCEVARSHLEGSDGTGGILGRAISRHMFDGILEGFPNSSRIEIPQPPLVSVASVTYYDADNVQRTFEAASYHVVPKAFAPVLQLASTASWPSTYDRPDAVTIRFVCGPAEIAADIMHAIKLHVGHLYLNREVAMEKSLTTMPMGYTALIGPHKTHGWI